MKRISNLLVLFIFVFFMASCGGSTSETNDTDENTNTELNNDTENPDADIEEEIENGTHEGVDLYSFITGAEQGWTAVDFVYFFTFMEDGRVHIQGEDGEATMWEGTWTLDGDELTAVTDEFTQTYIIQADGEFLIIDGNKFKKDKW